jgi:hypothetical protein
MEKQTFDIDDEVIYNHPLTDTFIGAVATIIGKVTVIGDDEIKVKFILGTVGNPNIVEMWCDRRKLKSKVYIVDRHDLTKRLDAAERISCENWDGWIFDESSDKYFQSFDELLENYEGDDEYNIPNWAWATRKEVLEIPDAIALIESRIENFDAGEIYELDDFTGIAELQQAIDIFNKLNQKKVYSPDYKKAVLWDSNH